MSNKMQRYTVYFIWKVLYMFSVVPPPIITSANNCIYSIWYLSHLSAAGSSNGVTYISCCRYSCLRSCCWVVVLPKTCRAVSRKNKLCNVASCWIYIRIQFAMLLFPFISFFVLFFCSVLLPINLAKSMLLAATPYTRYMVTRLVMLPN